MIINIESPNQPFAVAVAQDVAKRMGLMYLCPHSTPISDFLIQYEQLFNASDDDMLQNVLIFLEYAIRAEFVRLYHKELANNDAVVTNFTIDPIARYLKLSRYNDVPASDMRQFLRNAILISGYDIKPTLTFVFIQRATFAYSYEEVLVSAYHDLEADLADEPSVQFIDAASSQQAANCVIHRLKGDSSVNLRNGSV